MNDQLVRPAYCEACAFWRKLREHEGLCARHAPETSVRPEEVAHWPQTHGWQGCGEGVTAEAGSIGSHCARCVYWRRPEGGLNPVNRRRHARGVVGACRDLRPPRALPSFGARTKSVLACDPGYGLLRRGLVTRPKRTVVGRAGAALTNGLEWKAPDWRDSYRRLL